MKILLVLFIAAISCAQSSHEWRNIEVDLTNKYLIDSEDQVYLSDFGEANDTVRASIEVRNEDHVFSKIKLSRARLINDTLRIKLHTTTPANHHEYEITIANGKYAIKYRFVGCGGEFDEVLKPTDTRLKLNSNRFKKGDILRGYTEFKTKCIKPCDGGLFSAIGNFKVIIR